MVTVKRFGLLLVQYPHTCLVPWTLGKVKNGRENNNFESKRKKKKRIIAKGEKERPYSEYTEWRWKVVLDK